MQDKRLSHFINLVKSLNEDAPTVNTGSSGATAGFSGGASTPVAGYDKVMQPMRKRYAKGGKNSRKHWLDYLKGKG